MPLLAVSALDVLLGLGFALVGFIVVALVCAAVLAMLHLVLPSTDSGATEADALNAADETERVTDRDQLDSEVNA